MRPGKSGLTRFIVNLSLVCADAFGVSPDEQAENVVGTERWVGALHLVVATLAAGCASASEASQDGQDALTLTATWECLDDTGVEVFAAAPGTLAEARMLTANFPQTSVVIACGDSSEWVEAQVEQARADGFLPLVKENAVYWAAGPGHPRCSHRCC